MKRRALKRNFHSFYFDSNYEGEVSLEKDSAIALESIDHYCWRLEVKECPEYPRICVQILDTISRTLARECLLLTVDQPPLWRVGNSYFSTGNDVDHE